MTIGAPNGLTSNNAALDTQRIHDADDVVNASLQGDLLDRNHGETRTSVVVGDTTPLVAEQLHGLLPELPAGDPAAMREQGLGTAPK